MRSSKIDQEHTMQLILVKHLVTMQIEVLEVSAHERAAAAYSNARTLLYQRLLCVVVWKRMWTLLLILLRLLLLHIFCFISCSTRQSSRDTWRINWHVIGA
jgi:hypothetical protein